MQEGLRGTLDLYLRQNKYLNYLRIARCRDALEYKAMQ